MRIINILEEGRFGGPQRRVMEVGVELLKHDVRTLVIIPNSDSLEFRQKLDLALLDYQVLSIHRLTSNPVGLLKYLISFLPEVWKLKTLINNYKPCIVHVNGSYQIKGVLASQLARVESVWHLNDTYAPALVKGLFSLTKRMVKTHFISAAQRTKTYYLGNDAQQSQSPVVNEPVDCNYFVPQPRIGIDKKSVVRVVLVGNLSPVKGIEVFLEMAAYVTENSGRVIEFLIVGKKLDSQLNYFDLLSKKQNELGLDNIKFLGGLDDVKTQLQQADIYVCSSFFESSPMSIWEAMSMGLPIISTDVGDVKSIVKDGRCGFVVDTGDSIKLGQHVLHYIDNPEIAKTHGDLARQKALTLLDLPICAKAHLKLYHEIWNN